MSTVLITGASGYLGKALIYSLGLQHNIMAMSRNPVKSENVTYVQGRFNHPDDLRKLDSYQIGTLIHLAAVTSNGSEDDCMQVNVEGTRCLLNYLVNRGCKKFVMASSIAVIGLQSPDFRPLQLPVPDEHPCLDQDGYGFSKYLMEELTRYYHRKKPEIDVINLRLAVVNTSERPNAPLKEFPLKEWAMAGITAMLTEDAVIVFKKAIDAEYKPGVRIMNAAPPLVCARIPTKQILTSWFGNAYDLGYFEKAGHEYASVFDVDKIRKEIGFVAVKTLETLKKFQKT